MATSSSTTLLLSNPIEHFEGWYKQARQDPQLEMPDAMCLSTVNARGRPAARMVLLKDVTAKGFTFYTNSQSPKGRDLKARPHAALTFYWATQRRQVRIEGLVSIVPKKVADAYFASRPRLSQLGSWTSHQSETLASREVLLEAFDALLVKYEGKKIPAPPYWQGYCVAPERVEFWQERPNRLHDRWVYTRGRTAKWALTRLYP